MSEQINDGGPAFPRSSQGPSGDLDMTFGMSRRDYFAAKAMQGMLSSNATTPPHMKDNDIFEAVSKSAFKIADAMIAEGDKR